MKTIDKISLLLSLLIIPAVVSCLRADGMTPSAGTMAESDLEGGPARKEILIKAVRDSSLLFRTPQDALRYMEHSTHKDCYSKGILPQMAEDELDYASRLLNNSHDGFIVVDKGRMKVIKFDRFGVEQASFGMACAKNYGAKHKGWDSRTPEGFFSVKKIQNSEEWHYVDENGVVSQKKGEYGPRFIRINTPVTNSIGIHGTCAPWSIGGRRSHGCIRIKNENILRLVEMVDSGMPVIITPGLKDMAVNKAEGYDIPSISTIPGKAHTVLQGAS